MSLEELLKDYYFPTIGVAYPRQGAFISSVVLATNKCFAPLSAEYPILLSFILEELAKNPSSRAKLQNFNRMRFHIQTEIQHFPGAPSFEYVNI